MKAAMMTKPEGRVWVWPTTDSKGVEYYVVQDDAGTQWGFASTLEEARILRLEVMARR